MTTRQRGEAERDIARPRPPNAVPFQLQPMKGSIIMHTHRIMNLDLDIALLEADLRNTRRFRYSDAYSEFICGEWRSCMLWNKSGDIDDNFLKEYDHSARMTANGEQMPYLAGVLRSTFNLDHLRFARLAKLTPGSVLIPHRDYLELKHGLTRVHVPLVTDPRCFSAEENTVYQMRPGEVWFIDATQIHSAANFSKKARTHLILDFAEVERIETVLKRPAHGPTVIPRENIVRRKPLGPGEKEAFFALARVFDPANCKDVFAMLIKKYFTTDLAVTTVVDWVLEIAHLSGNSEVIARVQWIYEHCLIRR
jgi:hypothetical protein